MSDARAVRVTGSLQVKGPRGGRRWHAFWSDVHGRHQRVLGPAHVKDSGRRTARGATIWRAGDGPRPSPTHLTPDDATAELRQILAHAPTRAGTGATDGARPTFGAACGEWLRYVEYDKQRAASTLQDYRNVVRRYLIPALGADTPLDSISTATIDAYRERLLEEGDLSRRTIQKILVLLHGILKRAKRKGWIASNPSENAERVTVKRSGDFNVLTPVEIAAVVRAAAREDDGALFTVAAFTGLRMGELRALRWIDVDFARRVVMVRRNYTHGGEARPKSGRVRSVPLIDQAATALARLNTRDRWTEPGDLVFPNEVGTFANDIRLRTALYRALEDAGLGHLRAKDDRFVFHDLRHTFGTLAVQVFALTDVKAYMGHESIETTMIYIHHVPQHDAAERLSAAVAASSSPAALHEPRSARPAAMNR